MVKETKQATRVIDWIYDARIRSVIAQISLIAAIVLGGWWLAGNAVANITAQGKSLGFGFLTQIAGFEINRTLGTYLFSFDVNSSTYFDVYLIGIVNTFLVAVLGVVVATIIGFTMGVMRLSENVILRAFSTVYVELLRNIPILLQLFFWYFAVLRSLPGRQDKIDLIPEFVGINITGLYLPAPVPMDGFGLSVIALVVAIIMVVFMKRWAAVRQMKTGQAFPVFWASLGLIIGLPVITLAVTGNPLHWNVPQFNNTGSILSRGYQDGTGMALIPEMLAVWLALSLYTAAFIAENVRSGILAVSKGQTEASSALGLRPQLTLRLVVIPQAMRVIIPPLTSQYLNLTKNSSLAVAIAYPELVSIFAGTAMSQVGREIEMILMMMAVYLTFSILTAIFMNWFNAKVKLVER